jgi:hypothetical protein
MGGLTFVARNGSSRGTFGTSAKNLAPRIGFAYQLTSKMVVRGGYGIFFSPIGADQLGINQAGFSVRTNLIPSNDNGQTYIASIANPFSSGLQKPTEVNLTTYVGRAVTASPELRPNPYMQRWSFSVQREFRGRILLEVGYLNDSDAQPEKAIAEQDRAHRLTIASVYELPFGRGRLLGGNMNRWLDAALGGWQLQAIFQGQSGPPLAFGNIIFRGNVRDIVLPVGERSITRWFNTGAPFEKDSTKQLGSNIRAFPSRLTGLRGPGDNYWDMSLSKTLKITERLKMQVRTQWEGAMNHPQFNNPNMAPTNTLFGTITAIRGEARRIYVGAKLVF